MQRFFSSLRIQIVLGGFVLMSLIVGFLCISFIHATKIHAGTGSAHMNHKAFVGLNSCCDAGVGDHMELWKSTLIGIPQNIQNLFALLTVSLVVAFAFSRLFSIPRIEVNLSAVRYRQYVREHPNIALFDPLRLAFARGILHPKTF